MIRSNAMLEASASTVTLLITGSFSAAARHPTHLPPRVESVGKRRSGYALGLLAIRARVVGDGGWYGFEANLRHRAARGNAGRRSRGTRVLSNVSLVPASGPEVSPV